MKWSAINKLAAVFMITLIVFIVAKRFVFDNDKLNSNHRYTVATVYKISYPAEGGPDADFVYCVNERKYTGSAGIYPNERKVCAGKKFLLKYHPPDPAISQILFDKPLDSSSKPTVIVDVCRLTAN